MSLQDAAGLRMVPRGELVGIMVVGIMVVLTVTSSLCAALGFTCINKNLHIVIRTYLN